MTTPEVGESHSSVTGEGMTIKEGDSVEQTPVIVEPLNPEQVAEIVNKKKRRKPRKEKGEKKDKKKRLPTAYNLFTKEMFLKPEIKALPANQRMKRIAKLWKEEKGKYVSSKERVPSLIERAENIRKKKDEFLNPKQVVSNPLVDDLVDSEEFPLKRIEGEMLSREFGSTLPNVLSCENPNTRPLFSGEKHGIEVKRKEGSLSVCNYNYLGPGTNVRERAFVRQDPPINDLDSYAKQHDLDYLRLKEILNNGGEVSAEEIREVDEKFLNGIKSTTDDNIMKEIVIALFNAKYVGEDLGILSPLKFVNGGV